MVTVRAALGGAEGPSGLRTALCTAPDLLHPPRARQEEEEGDPEGWVQLEEQHHPPSHSGSNIFTPWGSTQLPQTPKHDDPQSRASRTAPGVPTQRQGMLMAPPPPVMWFAPPVLTGQGRNLFLAVPWTGWGLRKAGNETVPAPAEPVQPTVSHWESPGKHTMTWGNWQAGALPLVGSPPRNVIPTSARVMLPTASY